MQVFKKQIEKTVEHFKIMACQICPICKGKMTMGSSDHRGMHYYCNTAMEEAKKSKWLVTSPEWQHLKDSERYVNEEKCVIYEYCGKEIEKLLGLVADCVCIPRKQLKKHIWFCNTCGKSLDAFIEELLEDSKTHKKGIDIKDFEEG